MVLRLAAAALPSKRVRYRRTRVAAPTPDGRRSVSINAQLLNRRRCLSTALAATALLVTAADAGASNPGVTGPLRVDGRWLKDTNGRIVIVHGLQLAHKRPPYHPPRGSFTGVDARLIKRLGFNAIRLAWMWKGLEPRRGRYSEAYRSEILREGRLLTKRDTFVLLESHQDVYNDEKLSGVGFPDWATFTDGLERGPPTRLIDYSPPGVGRAFDSLYANRRGIADAYAAAWERMAKGFRRNPMILGYDLINEPWPGGRWPECLDGCADLDRGPLQSLQNRLARGVRKVDRRSPVWYEPYLTFGGTAAPSALRSAPRGVRPAGFAFHVYCSGNSSAPPDAESRGPRYRECARENDPRAFDNAERTARALGGPPLFDEFGDSQDKRHVERLIEEADSRRMGWLYWGYKDWEDVPGGPGDGSLFADDDDNRTLRRAHVRVLSRPYPMATAGTPLRYRFDRPRRRFTFTYAPSRRVTAPTVVYVPTVAHYKRGYRVRVRGARVLSRCGSRYLRLRPTRRARRVSVRVAPGRCPAKPGR